MTMLNTLRELGAFALHPCLIPVPSIDIILLYGGNSELSKRLGQVPRFLLIHKLLGGQRDSIRLYARKWKWPEEHGCRAPFVRVPMSYTKMGLVCDVSKDLDITSTELLMLLLWANHQNDDSGKHFSGE